jgi:hypothetical protein
MTCTPLRSALTSHSALSWPDEPSDEPPSDVHQLFSQDRDSQGYLARSRRKGAGSRCGSSVVVVLRFPAELGGQSPHAL